jgi:hypothetical protein
MAEVQSEVVSSEVVSEVESSRRVARAVWGLLLIWMGAAVFLRWGWGVGAVGAGAILLGAQAVRRYRRLAVDVFGLIAGALLVVSGAGSLFRVAIDLFPLLIVAAGVVLLVSAWTTRARPAPGGRSELHAPPRL